MKDYSGDNKRVLQTKSYSFALRTIKLYNYLKETKAEYALSRQLLRSGTAIGALVSESEFAQSKADFANKLSVSLKEANETRYWLRLMKDSKFISEEEFSSINPDIEEIIKLLVASIKTAKRTD
ncbi:MAG: four helix bundle protein [Sphingobacteriales bacterium JAD_PAG50586_3]|nr:MAG: four helix bundle protein [Sphingobacteriales bacterium JAD_PAG50586_3]